MLVLNEEEKILLKKLYLLLGTRFKHTDFRNTGEIYRTYMDGECRFIGTLFDNLPYTRYICRNSGEIHESEYEFLEFPHD